MMADLTDEDELTNGKKRPGLFFALLTTTDKVGAAAGRGHQLHNPGTGLWLSTRRQ